MFGSPKYQCFTVTLPIEALISLHATSARKAPPALVPPQLVVRLSSLTDGWRRRAKRPLAQQLQPVLGRPLEAPPPRALPVNKREVQKALRLHPSIRSGVEQMAEEAGVQLRVLRAQVGVVEDHAIESVVDDGVARVAFRTDGVYPVHNPHIQSSLRRAGPGLRR